MSIIRIHTVDFVWNIVYFKMMKPKAVAEMFRYEGEVGFY